MSGEKVGALLVPYSALWGGARSNPGPSTEAAFNCATLVGH